MLQNAGCCIGGKAHACVHTLQLHVANGSGALKIQGTENVSAHARHLMWHFSRWSRAAEALRTLCQWAVFVGEELVSENDG